MSSALVGTIKEQHPDQGPLTGLLFIPETESIWVSHKSGHITIWYKPAEQSPVAPTTPGSNRGDKGAPSLSAAQRASTTSLSSSAGSTGGRATPPPSSTLSSSMLLSAVTYLGTLTAHGAAISAITKQQGRIWTASIDRSIIIWQPIRHTSGANSNAGRWAVQVAAFEQTTVCH